MKLQTHLDLDIYTLRKKPSFQLRQILWLVFSIIELLLIARFLLKAFVPQSVSGIPESFIYSTTEYLLTPLAIIFGASSASGPVFEWMTVFAILFYWIVLVGILAWLETDKNVSRIEVARAYSKKKYGH